MRSPSPYTLWDERIGSSLRVALLCVLLSFLALTSITAQSGDSTAQGEVTGHILQGTDNAFLPQNLTVTLHILDAILNEQTLETQTDSQGNFAFTDIPISEDHFYFVSVKYHGHAYASPPSPGNPETPLLRFSVVIYEPTDNPDVIHIVGMSMQIDIAESSTGALQIIKMVRIRNSSSHIYTGNRLLPDGRPAVLEIAMPVGAVVIGLEDEGRFVVDEDTFTLTDTRPLPPGDELIRLVYLVPYQNGAIIEYPVYYALDGPLRVLIGTSMLSLTSDDLSQLETEPTEADDNTQETLTYGGILDLNPGELIRFELIGQIPPPNDTAQSTATNGLVTFVAGVLVLVVGLVAGSILLSRKNPSLPSNMAKIAAIERQLARLETQHDLGEINHDLYHQRRTELQTLLNELTAHKQTESQA